MSSSLARCPLRTNRRLRVSSAGFEHVASAGPSPLSAKLMGGQSGRGLVASLNGLSDLHLELGVEEWDPPDLLEIGMDRIFGTARGFIGDGRARLPGRVTPPRRVVGPADRRRVSLRTSSSGSSSSSSRTATPSALIRPGVMPSTSGVSSTVVQRIDELVLGEVTLFTTDRQRRIEVDLRVRPEEGRCSGPPTVEGGSALGRQARRPPPLLTLRSPAPSQLVHSSDRSLSVSHATNRSAALRPEAGSSSSASQRRTCAVSAAPDCHDASRPRDDLAHFEERPPGGFTEQHQHHRIHWIAQFGITRQGLFDGDPPEQAATSGVADAMASCSVSCSTSAVKASRCTRSTNNTGCNRPATVFGSVHRELERLESWTRPLTHV